MRQSVQSHVAPWCIALLHSTQRTDWGLHERAGTCSRQLSSRNGTAIGRGEETGVKSSLTAESQRWTYPEQFGLAAISFVFRGRNAGQTKRPSRVIRRAFVRRDFITTHGLSEAAVRRGHDQKNERQKRCLAQVSENRNEEEPRAKTKSAELFVTQSF